MINSYILESNDVAIAVGFRTAERKHNVAIAKNLPLVLKNYGNYKIE